MFRLYFLFYKKGWIKIKKIKFWFDLLHNVGRSFAVLKFGLDLLGPYKATIPSAYNNLKASTISS